MTIRNPWAAAIVLGHKDVENRTWKAPAGAVGRRFYVHVGQRYDREAVGAEGVEIHGLPGVGVRGAVIGSVELAGCTPAEDCQLSWCMGRAGSWAWLLRGARVYREPVAMGGALGLFEPAASVVEALQRAEAGAEEPAAFMQRWLERQRAAAMAAAADRGELGRLD